MKRFCTLCWALSVWPLAALAEPLPDCNTLYPSAMVVVVVSDPTFKQCGHVVRSYSGHVVQQRDLLLRLQPAYERELAKKEGPGPEAVARREKKINAFGLALERLASAGVPPNVETAASAPLSVDAKALLLKWLNAFKLERQSMVGRINDIGAVLRGDERAAFCLHDYQARISAALEKKVAAACALP